MADGPFYLGPSRRLNHGPTCPSCGRLVNGFAGVGEAPDKSPRPSPGDFTICLYCGAVLVFSRGLKLRHPTRHEQREIDAHPAIKPMLMAQAAMSGRKPS